MKINPSVGGVDQGKATSSATERTASNGATAASSPASGDTIHLSSLSSQLSALQETLSTGSEFDRAKVDAIKDAIREGRLTVNAERVAERMLATALAMIRKDS